MSNVLHAGRTILGRRAVACLVDGERATREPNHRARRLHRIRRADGASLAIGIFACFSCQKSALSCASLQSLLIRRLSYVSFFRRDVSHTSMPQKCTRLLEQVRLQLPCVCAAARRDLRPALFFVQNHNDRASCVFRPNPATDSG